MKSINKKILLSVFGQLDEAEQSNIVSYAEFLLSKSMESRDPATLEKPQDIKRPEDEKVVMAIKRLSKTYPMINKSGVLDQAAKLMTDHMLHGKEAISVIDELQSLFLAQYEKYCNSFDDKEK
ncbi:MAG: hypothetical protein QM479_14465 [Pseudomonadota bacterium]